MLAAVFTWLAAGVWLFAAARTALDARQLRRRVIREWRERHPTSRDEFLVSCDIPERTGIGTNVAVVAREVLADLGGGLPPESIRAEDSLAEPIWDNLWWSEVFFRIEIGAGVKVKDWGVVRDLPVGRHRSQLRVRDLVRAVATSAVPIDRFRPLGCVGWDIP